jgi:hypothetical protein
VVSRKLPGDPAITRRVGNYVACSVPSKTFTFILPLLVPHISIHDVTVREGDGSVTVLFNRTGGDLSFASNTNASTVVVAGKSKKKKKKDLW